MKKIIIFAIAVATLFAFSSCQKENLQDNGLTNGVRIITAEFENNATKTNLNSDDGLTPEWEFGDKIMLLNNSDQQEIEIISGSGTPSDGKAYINGTGLKISTHLDNTLYAVYPATATSMTSCTDGKITFAIPAVQDGTFGSANICVAKSTEDDGTNKDNLIFRNATAVLKITTSSAVVGVDVTATNFIAGEVTATFSGTAISLTTTSLDRYYVSAVGTSAPTGNVFYLAAAPVTTGAAKVNCYTTEMKGTVEKESKDLSKNIIYNMDLTSVVPAISDLTGQHGLLNGHEYVIIKAKYDGTNDSYLKWATMNIGATALTGTDSYGDLFSWGEVAKKDNYGQTYYVDPAKSINTNIAPDSGYDAARVNWGGTWRMPTGDEDEEEFKALRDATYWSWEDSGYYVYAPQSGDAGKKNSEKGSGHTYDKSNALLFFPAAGFSNSDFRTYDGSYGYYWSSTWCNADKEKDLFFDSSYVDPQNSVIERYSGLSVRPVSD